MWEHLSTRYWMNDEEKKWEVFEQRNRCSNTLALVLILWVMTLVAACTLTQRHIATSAGTWINCQTHVYRINGKLSLVNVSWWRWIFNRWRCLVSSFSTEIIDFQWNFIRISSFQVVKCHEASPLTETLIRVFACHPECNQCDLRLSTIRLPEP